MSDSCNENYTETVSSVGLRRGWDFGDGVTLHSQRQLKDWETCALRLNQIDYVERGRLICISEIVM